MKALPLLLVTIMACSCAVPPQKFNRVVVDKKSGKEVLIGYCTREGLKGDVFGSYFETEYNSYEPETRIIEKLKSLPGDWTATIVLGTWCSDSHREVPRFFRIMDEAGFQDSQVSLICVDRAKEAEGVDISELGVTLVPTFIFYRKGKEMGRIIETPVETLEMDMLVALARPAVPPTPGKAPK